MQTGYVQYPRYRYGRASSCGDGSKCQFFEDREIVMSGEARWSEAEGLDEFDPCPYCGVPLDLVDGRLECLNCGSVLS